MRPVNLIPPEDRRRDATAPTRTGPFVYVLVGVLVVAVAVVAAVTHYGKQIEENQAKIDSIQSEVDAANARAESLSSFTSFQGLRDSRVATIDALAKSRFDWERVLREMARVIPKDVAITNVTGTINPAVTVTDEAGIALRDSIPGPALEITGCSKGQRNVAIFIASLHDIDGVTRVTAAKGIRGTVEEESADSAASGSSASGDCGRGGDSAFEIVAAFDPVPTPDGALPETTPGAVPASVTTPETASSTESTTADPESSAQQAESQQAIDNASAQAGDAASLAGG